MTLFYLGAGIGVLLAAVYLTVGTLSFLRIRRELAQGNGIDALADEVDSSEIALVPGFSWKASLAVLTSFVLLVIASYSGAFWYVLAFSGLGTAAAVIVAFVLELRGDRARSAA
ncbi:hypothetical protein H7J51_18270 [Mycobacterium crocinum]|uniref:Uncharacterized protein n=1 Tax=Mycolicibacterium crocinum TaxID=388459 RepID=A0ABY3TQL2_9MYCO|nr:hypothetical protein [Mycolicibacterium crocinum]MCV7217221.1 hypothetical protein [Mycolicibacterium crocinum]ULN42957.1 hypothetical protein MI149_07675 [Mycolicibacterium crocinum]